MKRAHGFTLMELVLVLGLFAAMAALSLPVVRYLQVQGQQTRELAQRVEAERAGWYWLRQAVSRASPVAQGVDAASGRDVLWIGESQHMRFQGLLPPTLPQTGPRLQELRVVPEANGLSLHYRVATQVLPEGSFTDTPVFQGAQRIAFSYRRFVPAGRLSEWLEVWPDVTQMPVQVRIQVWRKGAAYPVETRIILPYSEALSRTSIDAGARP